MSNPIPLPADAPITEPNRLMTDSWNRYFQAIGEQLNRAPKVVATPVSLTAQSASIASTSIVGGQTAAGLYRVSYYARITVVGTVSSSLTVTLGWTDHTQAMTVSGTAITGNTVTTFQDATHLIYMDANSAPTYSTTYASNAAGEMNYELYVCVEAVAL